MLAYWVCWFSIPIQNLCLLLAGLLFYSWGAPAFLAPMAFLEFRDAILMVARARSHCQPMLSTSDTELSS